MSSPAVGSDAWKAQDKGPTIVVVCWIVTAVSTLFVLGRVYVRGRIMRKFHSDDWFIILGQICGYISTALSTVAVSYGNGRHMTLLSTEQQQGAILWTTAAFCPGIMSFGLPKMAVVSLLTRLMNPGKYHKWFLWWMAIWCQLTLFVTAGLLLGRCMPARSLWDFSVPGTCFDVSILVNFCIYAGAFSAFVDVYLAVYPAIVLFSLQMSTKKKIALSCALGIGSVSGVVAIYKTTRIPSLGSKDFSYDTSDLVVWTVIEGSTIIIASSIPVMQPLLELILRRNPFSSGKGTKPTPQYYENYGSQSKSKSRGGTIELGQRKPKSKPKDDLGFTIIDDGDSQENIFKPAADHQTSAASGSPTPTSNHSDSSHRAPDGKIVRTDFPRPYVATMSDPLSTAGSVVGIISLGIQVTQSLYDYYSAFKSQPSDVSHTLQKLQSLQTALQQLSSQLTDRSPPPGDSELAQNIETTVRQCEECIEELEEEVKKFQKTKTDSITSNLKATGRRLAYPFRQSTLHKLDEDIDDLVSRLSFALSLLQQKTVDHIQDDVQDMRAILDLIRAQQVSDEIQDWLNAPDASVNFNENHKKKHPGTGLWLVKGPNFATWLDKQNSFLWLKGFAGCGKSVLCSTAIQHTMRRRGFDSSSRVGVAFFFFTFNDNTKQSTSAMLRALILQLSGQVKDSPIALTQLHKQNKRTAPTDSSLLDCLRQILSTFQDVYILLDALDESPRGTHREAVLDALAGMRGWTGTHLHLLVTSRDEVDIRDALQATDEESVSLQSEGIDRDIADFVSQHLRDNRRLHKWRDSYDEIEDVLTQKAKGVFRWVECQFRDLASCPKSPSLLTKLLHSLPQTLDGTYERMIQNIPPISRDYARQMLTVLCCATRPLTVPELIDALAVDLSGTPKFDARRKLTDLDGLQEVCPGFIEIDLNKVTGSITVRLAHFSVQEYLESGRILEDGLAAPFIIRRNHGHGTIASICLTLLVHPQLWCLSPDDARTEFPLAQYAAKEWLYHYTKSTKTERLDAQTVQLMAGGDEPFNSWVHIWNVLDTEGKVRRANIPTALYYASRYGIQPVVEYLCRPQNLGLNDMLNAQYGEYETPLQAAAAYGHTEAVQLLLQNGANARATHCYDDLLSSPLYAAARFGSCEIVEMLVNGGANIDAMIDTGYSFTTALYEAAKFGHSVLVRWLLDKGAKTDDIASDSAALLGADVNMTCGGVGSALQVVCGDGGHGDLAELLLKHNADVNLQSGYYETALIAASAKGHGEMVALLLKHEADVDICSDVHGTALTAAITGCHLDIAKTLLENNADADIQGNMAGTALHAAVSENFVATAKLLIDHGADVTIQRGYDDATALSLASHALIQWENPPPANYPEPNQVYTEGQDIELRWSTSFATVDISVTQGTSANDPAGYIFKGVTSPKTWKVNFAQMASFLDRSLTEVYYFRMYEAGAGGLDFETSHYFNLTAAATSATSTPASSPTSSPSSTPTPSPDPNTFSGGAVAGVAVGAVAGTLIIGGIVGWVIWRRRRKARLTAEVPVQGQDKTPLAASHELLDQSSQRFELSHEQRFELNDDGSRGARHEMP
ncbi:hypothetical protein CkaCkLH20_11207 [Colletotrichum karsti]|uniref:NACHT domain-containing protein n=1 Tax=Colletotrichum karsti TaxID=1095194 RepID=A0A9P6HY86_9PEZI|nr:uncharacterized protein CkaCkLH20_11207 [Colletotrichum karsti]KAF9871286.1 hypothetical protein CkaCkLH20_11207 [Colletotrichum karsti]